MHNSATLKAQQAPAPSASATGRPSSICTRCICMHPPGAVAPSSTLLCPKQQVPQLPAHLYVLAQSCVCVCVCLHVCKCVCAYLQPSWSSAATHNAYYAPICIHQN
eukprot:1158317-Pelagomonas_calceolata.AAC.8